MIQIETICLGITLAVFFQMVIGLLYTWKCVRYDEPDAGDGGRSPFACSLYRYTLVQLVFGIIAMVGFLLFWVQVCGYYEFVQLSHHVSCDFVIFTGVMNVPFQCLFFHASLMRIDIDRDDIVYRNGFGIVHKYSMDDVTQVCLTSKASLKVYVGSKHVFSVRNTLCSWYRFFDMMSERDIYTSDIK